MFAGFDYGTSNCAIGVINTAVDAQVQLLDIDQGRRFMPSTLYALERELICEAVAQQIGDLGLRDEYLQLRQAPLAQARRVRLNEAISSTEQSVFVGTEAFEQYLAFPEDGYFVKSPKSFLGASGLRPEFVSFFEDLVTAMMQQIKQRAELAAGHSLEQVVIGRPVNFQGSNAEASNAQALAILSVAARRAGFKTHEFLFEPLAAGLDFESCLVNDKTVLVVDIGGGTTDCSMVRMGPKHRSKTDREADFLGHTGERVGGNDLDIQLAARGLLPLFGMQSLLKSGLPMPTQPYWDAVSVNNVAAQTRFNSLETTQQLKQLRLNTREPEEFDRFLTMRRTRQNYQVVRTAEQTKIALSEALTYTAGLGYIEAELTASISREALAGAIQRPLDNIIRLMREAISQAGCQPDLVYVTGGSAQSPVIRQAITAALGSIELVDGDHFGSVAAGLTLWAAKVFR